MTQEFRKPGRWELMIYGLVRLIVKGICKLLWRIEVHGKEHLPASGPFILAPVHRSNIDFAVVSVLTTRRLRYMTKDSVWKVPLAGRLASILGSFPVARGTADREAMRTVGAILDVGEPVVMFPEGTRRSGRAVEDLFDGPAYVAAKAGVPIVPVGIGNSEQAMPKGAKLPRPVKLVLVAGEPLTAPAATEGGRVSRRSVREQTELLRTTLQKLFDEAQERAGVHPSPNSR